jgi:phosphomethylpyrimidine synthase
MKITEDVRKYAAENALDETVALEHGMPQKAAEFQHSGAELYSKPR